MNEPSLSDIEDYGHTMSPAKRRLILLGLGVGLMIASTIYFIASMATA